jgi:hypothetical protein
LIIYGWLGRPTVLAQKPDLCATCGVLGPHAIVRVTRWATLFWVPFLPIWISHKLICGHCGAQTKLGWRQVRAATTTGKLPLPHRAGFDAYAQKAYDETYRRPVESELDPIVRNPKRDPWNTYLNAWPVIVIALVVVLAVWPRSGSQATSGPGPSASHLIVDHTCWLDTNGAISGCRMLDGTILGVPTGTETTCYFQEPMPTGNVQFRCKG